MTKQKCISSIIAGMPRGGTTMLHHVFGSHPKVYLPLRKETSFFTFQYDKGAEWYESLFRKRKPDMVPMDISGNYILVGESIPRILEYNADAKVIISVRDPAQVVVSLFKLMANWDKRTPPLRDFAVRYQYRFGRKVATFHFADGLLRTNLEKYRRAFGDRLMLLDYRVFRSDLISVLRAVEQFFGLERHFESENLPNRKINSSSRRNIPILSDILSSDAVSAVLYDYYPETSRLFPDQLFRAAKKYVDILRVRESTAESPSYVSDEDVEVVRRLMADQTEYVHSLFVEAPIMLGSGKPYEQEPGVTNSAP